MKPSFIQLTKNILADRQLFLSFVALLIAGLIFCIYVVLNIHVSELQVVTHYSAFGTTNFYRDKWYYLVGFVMFGILNVVAYAALTCKIFVIKGRDLAIPFAWLGVTILLVAASLLSQVFKVASLS